MLLWEPTLLMHKQKSPISTLRIWLRPCPKWKLLKVSWKTSKTYDTEIKAMVKELEAKMNQYDSEAASKTQEENKKRVEEVQGMQKQHCAYRQQALQDLQKGAGPIPTYFWQSKTTIQKWLEPKASSMYWFYYGRWCTLWLMGKTFWPMLKRARHIS